MQSELEVDRAPALRVDVDVSSRYSAGRPVLPAERGVSRMDTLAHPSPKAASSKPPQSLLLSIGASL